MWIKLPGALAKVFADSMIGLPSMPSVCHVIQSLGRESSAGHLTMVLVRPPSAHDDDDYHQVWMPSQASPTGRREPTHSLCLHISRLRQGSHSLLYRNLTDYFYMTLLLISPSDC